MTFSHFEAAEGENPEEITEQPPAEPAEPEHNDYEVVYNEEDGYYHVGTASGPYLLADMLSGTKWSNSTLYEMSLESLCVGSDGVDYNKVIEDIPYLQGGNTTDKDVDTSSEKSLLEFFKTIDMYSPSGNSSNFRWLVTMSKEQLRNTLNVNLPLMVPTYKESYPILENGEWVIKDFPSDIGAIKNIFVSERGTSGVVISLQIEAENVTFRIYNQYNIRFTIRPKDCGSDVIRYNTKANTGDYTSSSINSSILTSGYFALEWKGDTLRFIGGGSGHGIGMCQYSANTYASEGKTYEEILNIFYKNIEFIDTSNEYTVLTDFEKYFS